MNFFVQCYRHNTDILYYTLKITIYLYLLFTVINFEITAVATSDNNIIKLQDKKSSLKADVIEMNNKLNSIEASGNVTIRYNGFNIHCDKISYDITNDILTAKGNISISDASEKKILGSHAIFKNKLKNVIIKEFQLYFGNNISLDSNTAVISDTDKIQLTDSVFTACHTDGKCSPIWSIEASKTNIDLLTHQITHKNMFFKLYNIPILYIPYLVHYTPNSPAKSGLLIPYIKNGSFILPIYWRAKNNLDFTLNLGIARKSRSISLETRNQLKLGIYTILLDYSHIKHKKSESYQDIQYYKAFGYKKDNYYFKLSGIFHNQNHIFGLDINATSSRHYLEKYHNIKDKYLASKIYSERIYNLNDFYSLNCYIFDNLRIDYMEQKKSQILPELMLSKIIYLNKEHDLYLKLNYASRFNIDKIKNLFQSNAELTLNKQFIAQHGSIIDLSLKYKNIMQYIHNKQQNTHNNKTNFSNIPEANLSWKLPLIKMMNSCNKKDSHVKIEPMISLIISNKLSKNLDNLSAINEQIYELNINNIFKRYSNCSMLNQLKYDTHCNFGINFDTKYNNILTSVFLGGSSYKNNRYITNFNIVINNIKLLDNIQLYYNALMDKKFIPINNEIGLIITNNRISLSSILSKINLEKYSILHHDISKNHNKTLKQASCNIKYQLFKNLKIGFRARAEINNLKFNIFQNTILVTYLNDCVTMDVEFSRNSTRIFRDNIKKIRGFSISLGLKAINM
ncbi:LPS-assembly protein LptD [Rickettsia endosymbiont of Cardiosporidium cionae]|uniref:LPS-assembly protein LptD n=1 Tax=Rickettsia endosymbiont of Cardiosporidium cionae TaxID=2777155 RepID=UPI0018952D92|nr:LPS-assembly protein LptD [Rickettsia endosymbiont of Cardiosporidium cionae]KAF8818169.1 LPS-assembly protein LptD [Rickettsia endosymbiont of Cardiosporidium cionae]